MRERSHSFPPQWAGRGPLSCAALRHRRGDRRYPASLSQGWQDDLRRQASRLATLPGLAWPVAFWGTRPARCLERDDFSSIRRPALIWWSMIFSENRYPPRIKSGAGLFGIMLQATTFRYSSAAFNAAV